MTDLRSAKIRFFTTRLWRPRNAAFCVSYAESSLTCKFELNTAILDFDRFEVSKKPILSQLVPETSKGAFFVSYAESSLTCKFELNTPAILDFLTDLRSAKIRFFTTRPGDLKWCVLC